MEPLILTISKNNFTQNVKYRRLLRIEDFKTPHLPYNQELWNNAENNYSIFLNVNPFDDNLLDKILNTSSPIGNLFDVQTGLQAYEYKKGIPKQTKKDVIDRIYDYSYQYDKNTFKYLDEKMLVGTFILGIINI